MAAMVIREKTENWMQWVGNFSAWLRREHDDRRHNYQDLSVSLHVHLDYGICLKVSLSRGLIAAGQVSP